MNFELKVEFASINTFCTCISRLKQMLLVLVRQMEYDIKKFLIHMWKKKKYKYMNIYDKLIVPNVTQ